MTALTESQTLLIKLTFHVLYAQFFCLSTIRKSKNIFWVVFKVIYLNKEKYQIIGKVL
jgi:hypothetical protein